MNERASRRTGRKKAKALWGEERQRWGSTSIWYSQDVCPIFVKSGQKLRQVWPPSYQAAFPQSVHPFGSPCVEVLGSRAPARGVLGAPMSCSPTVGTGLPGAPSGDQGLWPPLTTASYFGEPGGNPAAVSQRGFREQLFFPQKPFHQVKSEAAACPQKNLENQHYMWKAEDRALREMADCHFVLTQLICSFLHLLTLSFQAS